MRAWGVGFFPEVLTGFDVPPRGLDRVLHALILEGSPERRGSTTPPIGRGRRPRQSGRDDAYGPCQGALPTARNIVEGAVTPPGAARAPACTP